MIDACNKRIYEKRFVHSFLLASKKNAHIKKNTHTTWHKHTFNILKSPRWNREIYGWWVLPFQRKTRLTGNHQMGTWQLLKLNYHQCALSTLSKDLTLMPFFLSSNFLTFPISRIPKIHHPKSEKYAQVKSVRFPKNGRVENKEKLKPPPRPRKNFWPKNIKKIYKNHCGGRISSSLCHWQKINRVPKLSVFSGPSKKKHNRGIFT